ncbi:YheC/YheD family endospore coat-associated protein [Bacillus massilinigeriensis]|uniref:YheC/YheD family endospore coat-associated protein n=1 Tax=Bacillus massilionigeriensis TaxID=1805475 RepID=UPI001F2569F7|nr:YheC/YheD family protein [Bacillus massilionigeriensis]
MTSRKEDYSVAGNGPLFRKLQNSLMNLGGISIVFTPDDIHNKGMKGFLYLSDRDQWIRVEAPLPHLVYNRVPFRKIEKTDSFIKATKILQKHKIPFFNPGFIDKYELYLLLKEHPTLHQYLPYTEPILEENQLLSFIQKHRDVYLKPTLSAKGKGIYKLSLNDSEKIVVQSIKDVHFFDNYSDFWKQMNEIFTLESYLVQEEVTSSKIDNHRYDFRILSHYENGDYGVTGVGIRKSELQEITTHIPNGGKLLPYELLKTECHDQFIEKIVKELGIFLSEKLGFFGEFSIDAGHTPEGKYVIYEVNSKPMSFDEVHIENSRLEKLCKLFFQLSGFG